MFSEYEIDQIRENTNTFLKDADNAIAANMVREDFDEEFLSTIGLWRSFRPLIENYAELCRAVKDLQDSVDHLRNR